jgi:hypothetical protein
MGVMTISLHKFIHNLKNPHIKMIFLIMEKNKDILKTIDFLECDFWSQD